jgi:hypothetical protein
MSDTPKCPCCRGSDTGYYGLSINRIICHTCQCEWSESDRDTRIERELAEANRLLALAASSGALPYLPFREIGDWLNDHNIKPQKQGGEVGE